MQIKQLLNENAVLTFRDLNSRQVSVLKRIANGSLDPELANEKELEVLDSLVDMGLLTDLAYELTPQGQRVVQIARKYGSSLETRDAGLRDEKLNRLPFEKGNRRYVDLGDNDDFADDIDTDTGVRLKNLDTDVVDNEDLKYMDR
jgi:hypothetical protein